MVDALTDIPSVPATPHWSLVQRVQKSSGGALWTEPKVLDHSDRLVEVGSERVGPGSVVARNSGGSPERRTLTPLDPHAT